MEIIKILLSLPKWLLLIPFRFITAFLNLFQVSRVCVCTEKDFFEYDQVGPIGTLRTVQSSEPLHLGHCIVAYLNGYCHKRELFQMEKSTVKGEEFDKVKNKYTKRAVHANQLKEVVFDCKILRN